MHHLSTIFLDIFLKIIYISHMSTNNRKESKIVYSIRLEPSLIKKYKKLTYKKAKILPDGRRVTKGVNDLMRTVLQNYAKKYFPKP